MSKRRRLPMYWQSLEALRGDAATRERAGREFAEELPVGEARRGLERRDFFKIMGLSAAALASACSRAPVKKVVPHLEAPEEVTPGAALWYASTCGACAAHCGVLLKTRDGRPIKVEGNDAHPVSEGGVCAVGQASLLGLYDAARARGPLMKGKPAAWSAVDERARAGLAAAASGQKGIRLVLPPEIGPTAEETVRRFLSAFPGARVVRHDPAGDRAAIAEAHGIAFGARAVPSYRVDRARLVVSVSADFLGAWISPVALTRQRTRARDLTAAPRAMARHVQLEPIMTLTGSNADRRIAIAPGDELPVLAALVRLVAPRSAHPAAAEIASAFARVPAPAEGGDALAEIAGEIAGARGAALVLCGAAETAAQLAAAALNELAGAYGATIELGAPSPLEPDTIEMSALLDELRAGSVGALILAGANPVYDHPRGAEIAGLLAKVGLVISLADRLDETARAAEILAPDHHAFESWGDAAPRPGVLGLRQPGVSPLFDTRAAFESLLRWAGVPQSYHDFLRERWTRAVFPLLEDPSLSADEHWDRSLHDGFALVPAHAPAAAAFKAAGLSAALADAAPRPGPQDLAVVLYEKVGLRDGALANNAWLQELPDPISKATWTNYACLAPSLAASLGVRTGDLVRVTVSDRTIELPAIEQPGTHPRAVAIALGYGRAAAGAVGDGVGANAYPLARAARGRIERTAPGARVAKLGPSVELALAQTHASLEGRPHVHEASFAEYLANPRAGNEEGGHHQLSMWSGHHYDGHRWAMSIDLTACTGCSACVVACQAENNIPAVGVEEMRRGREMSWMRLDRYYSGDPASPAVVHQPMMCQHCENAPCETVCPVLATMHSTEGLNQQVYNRCVGTRYCANNCPPKVRRFNWFDYYGHGPAVKFDDPLGRMVLNPDVVVRSRGVMEKCSMCVQRIQEGKAAAKAEGRPLVDGEIKTACQQSCPAQAISFGDLNDPASRVAKLAHDPRSYRVLADINVEPAVRYMTKVKNQGSET